MEKLLQCDAAELLPRLLDLKELYDDAGADAMRFFGDFNEDSESYEQFAYEDIYSMPEMIDLEYLYYDEAPPVNGDSEPDAYGEMWFFSSDAVKEYYRLLKELLVTKRIKRREYILRMHEMENTAIEYIVRTRSNYYNGGVWCEVDPGGRKKESCFKVSVCYESVFSAFEIACGVLALLAKYNRELKALRCEFPAEGRRLEAA